jgi:hypothetical protein
MGKTQVTLELAYRIREKYPECSVFWIPSASAGRIEQGYFRVGQQLGLLYIDPESDKFFA